MKVVVLVLMIVITVISNANVVALGWNWHVARHFGVREIDAWQGFAIVVLLGVVSPSATLMETKRIVERIARAMHLTPADRLDDTLAQTFGVLLGGWVALLLMWICK